MCGALFLLTSTGCIDKDSLHAIKSCRDDLTAVQRTSVEQLITIDNLKTQLAQAQTRVEELSRQISVGRAVKHGDAKKVKHGKAGGKVVKPRRAR
jgi:predicted  nucleic acid-binding Zn-ribbon protein